MTLDATVIVVNHDGKDYLDTCLAAIFRADPAEVLLVDSGSTDGAHEAAAERYPVRLIELDGNLGPSAARNLGLSQARCSTVILVDNDVEVTDGCLERLVDDLERREDVALVQARSVLGDETGPIHYDGGAFHYVGLIALRNWYAPRETNHESGWIECDVAISLCCAGRRDAILEAGGFDESMFILFEDLALSYALKMRGHRVGVDTSALCIHKGGTKGLSTRGAKGGYAGRRTFLHSRNRWIFLLTHYRKRALVAFAPGFLVYGIVHLGFVIAKGHLREWWRGKVALMTMRRVLRRRREIIQRGRVRRDGELLAAPSLTLNPGIAARGFRGIVRRVLDTLLAVTFHLGRWAA
ncbi:MAG: glycosyltransferase family 2 protein [Planctomycetes bacterium]|nr:glycosyltransferase family 2 protein [Planctomycetota bacterium]